MTSDHVHDSDSPHRCMECVASQVTADDVANALRALRVPVDRDRALTDVDMIPLLGELSHWLSQIMKHRVNSADLGDAMAFVANTPKYWAVLAAHSLLPAISTAYALSDIANNTEPLDPYAANTLNITHLSLGLFAEVMRTHLGHEGDLDELYRLAGSLRDGLDVLIEHRMLTPPQS